MLQLLVIFCVLVQGESLAAPCRTSPQTRMGGCRHLSTKELRVGNYDGGYFSQPYLAVQRKTNTCLLSTLDVFCSEKNEQVKGEGNHNLNEQAFEESNLRSLVKSMMWRMIAGTVTFTTSYAFSQSISHSLRIVFSDFFSKVLTMFIAERLLNKSSAGRQSGADSASRSLAKAILWRLFAICNTMLFAGFIAKDLSVASKIAGPDAIFKTSMMFAYERAWANVTWGKVRLLENKSPVPTSS